MYVGPASVMHTVTHAVYVYMHMAKTLKSSSIYTMYTYNSIQLIYPGSWPVLA